MKARKSKNFLSTLRKVLNVMVIAAWFSYLAAKIATSAFVDASAYEAAESFDGSAQDEMVAAEGPGTSVETYSNSGYETESTGTSPSLTGDKWNRVY